MTPQELVTAAGKLGNKIIELVGNDEESSNIGMPDHLKVTYLALLQLVASFAKSIDLPQDAVLEDLRKMMLQVDRAVAVSEKKPFDA